MICLHLDVYFYILPFVNWGVETTAIDNRLRDWQFFQQDMHMLRVRSCMELFGHIICVVPFAAICQHGVNNQFMAVLSGRAVTETLYPTCYGCLVGCALRHAFCRIPSCLFPLSFCFFLFSCSLLSLLFSIPVSRHLSASLVSAFLFCYSFSVIFQHIFIPAFLISYQSFTHLFYPIKPAKSK